MRKAIGYGLLYLMLGIGLSDFYFEYSPDALVGAVSVLFTLALTFGIAMTLIEGGGL